MNEMTGRTRAQRWGDAVLHRGPGYDLTDQPDAPRSTATSRVSGAVTSDLTTARSCRAAAFAAFAACVLLAAAGHWLASGLVVWMVPSLMLVAGQARRAHARQTAGRNEEVR